MHEVFDTFHSSLVVDVDGFAAPMVEEGTLGSPMLCGGDAVCTPSVPTWSTPPAQPWLRTTARLCPMLSISDDVDFIWRTELGGEIAGDCSDPTSASLPPA